MFHLTVRISVPAEFVSSFKSPCNTSIFTGKVHGAGAPNMATGTQLLKRLVNERLAAAAVEIFGLVENTIREYQDEVVRSRREIVELKEQLEQLADVKPEIILFTAGS